MVRRPREGELIVGTVTRSVEASPRTRVESFRIGLDVAESGVTGQVIGRYTFRGTVGQPILLWDGAMTHVHSTEEAEQFFAGNSAYPAEELSLAVDAAGFAPLPDADFWPIIDSLNGRLWEKTITAAGRQLSMRDEAFVLRWAETAGQKSLVLADVLEGSSSVSASEELHVIGAVLGKGRAADENVLADQGALDSGWMSDNSAQVIWIGSDALARQTSKRVQITTTFSLRHRDILNRGREEAERYSAAEGMPPLEPCTSYCAARAVVRMNGEYRERLVLIVEASRSPNEQPVAKRAVVASFGGDVVAVEYADYGMVGVQGGEVFTVKRRSAAPLDEYCSRYATTPDGL